MKEQEFTLLGETIAKLIVADAADKADTVVPECAATVAKLCTNFPVYP